jgi:hypothetical protein
VTYEEVKLTQQAPVAGFCDRGDEIRFPCEEGIY